LIPIFAQIWVRKTQIWVLLFPENGVIIEAIKEKPIRLNPIIGFQNAKVKGE